MVEGRQLVAKLLAAPGFRLVSILLTEPALARLGDRLGDVAVYLAREETLQAVVGFAFHGGCIGLGEQTAAANLEALLGARLLVVLERVTNPDNVGGVFRNAMAFGADGVLLSPGCADPLGRKALRASVGGALHVPFAVAGAWPDVLAQLKRVGFTLIALTPRPEAIEITTLGPAPARAALLLGTEENGLGAAALAAADVAARIAMAPAADALNVATAAAIALHRLSRPRR
jgi:tRNA G18 (ribose-2'-O)-methylase SpoU